MQHPDSTAAAQPAVALPALSGTYFTRTDDWLQPTELCRGPWDADSCHAGPPTAMLARAMEQALAAAGLTQSLKRITVNLVRPAPMAGFYARAEITRAGRSVTTLSASLVDADGRERINATGLALRADLNQSLPTIPSVPPATLTDAQPKDFPITRSAHNHRSFTHSIQTVYPDGHDGSPGPTTAWMRSVPLLPDEAPSPFQAICPLADCGNAFSRNAEPWEVAFVNADLTVDLHRAPRGEWFGTQCESHWHPDGTGLADALLFDALGPVGRALQTLLLTPSN